MAASVYPLHGGKGMLYAGATTATTAIAFFQDFEISGEVEINKSKYCRATAVVSHTDGIADRTCNFTALFKKGDAGQELFVEGAALAMKFEVDNNGAGADQVTIAVVVQRIRKGFPMAGFYTFEVSAQINGDPTWATVTG